MIEDVQNTRELLNAALDRYITACSAIITGSSHTVKSISQEVSDAVQKELDIISTKLTHAQAMVNRTMNDLPTHTRIHVLPSNIVAYIFQLVRDAQPDYLNGDKKPFSTTYPETLTHVCSRWRQIAIDSPKLWSHIQISDCRCTYSQHTRMLARAKVFAARAEPSPVDIHIIRGSNGCSAGDGLEEFGASVAIRTRSFGISAESSVRQRLPVFQSWLDNCKPGSLNELVLKRRNRNSAFEKIEVSEEHLLPIRVLQLTGTYFDWASQAYHGLVDLRLLPIPDGENSDITQSQLKAILMASPRLRELHFGLKIKDTLSNDSDVAVRLDELEVVNLCSMRYGGEYGPLLQLLTPGRKALQLSMNCRFTSSSFPGNDAIEFFARSNVTKLHIESSDTEGTSRHQPLVLLELLRHLPTLRALSLCHFYLGPNQDATDDQHQDHEPPSSRVDRTELRSHLPPQLDVVHLRDCTVDLDDLREVIRAVPVQRLKYRGCWFYSMEDGYSSEFENSQPQGLGDTFSYVSSSWPLDELDPWA